MHLGSMFLLFLVGICHQVYGRLPADFEGAYATTSPSGFPFYYYPGGLSLQENFPVPLPQCTYSNHFYTCNFASTDKSIVLNQLDNFPSRRVGISNANTVLMVLPLCDFNLKFDNVSKIQMGYRELMNLKAESCDDSFTAINSTVEDLDYKVSNVMLIDTHVEIMSSKNEMNRFLARRSTFGHIETFLSTFTSEPFNFVESSVNRISSMIIANDLIFVKTRIDLISAPGITFKGNSSVTFLNMTIGTIAKESFYVEHARLHFEDVTIERAEEHAFSLLTGAFLTMKNVNILDCDNCIRHHGEALFQLTNLTVNAKSVNLADGRWFVSPYNSSTRQESVSFAENALIVSDLENDLIGYIISGSQNFTKLICRPVTNSTGTSGQAPCPFESLVVTNGSVVNSVVEINVSINVTIDSSRVDGITTTSPITLTLVNADVGFISNVRMVGECYIGEGSAVEHMTNTSAVELFVSHASIGQIDDMVVEDHFHFVLSNVKRIVSINVNPNAELLLDDTVVDFLAPKSIYLAENASFTVHGKPLVLPPWPFVSAESYDQVNIEESETREVWLPSLVRLRLKRSVSSVWLHRVIDSRWHCTQEWNSEKQHCDPVIAVLDEPDKAATFTNLSMLQLAERGYPDIVIVENVETLFIPKRLTVSELLLTNSSIQEVNCQAHKLIMREVSCDILQPRLTINSVEMSNSTIEKIDVEIMHGNVTSSKIDHIFKIEFEDELVFSHSHIGIVHKYGIYVGPKTTLTVENTTIVEIESHGIIVEGTLVMKNIVIKNLKEAAIVLGSSGERFLHFENVSIEKGHTINFSELQRSFSFKNVFMNGLALMGWTPESLSRTTSKHQPNDAVVDKRDFFTSEGLSVPEDIQEEMLHHHGAHVEDDTSKPHLAILHSVVQSRQPRKEPYTTSDSVAVIVVGVLVSAFVVMLALVVVLRRRQSAKLGAASSALNISDCAPVVVTSPDQAMFGPAPSSTTVDMTEIDLTSRVAVYGAGGRGLIEPVEAMRRGWTFTPFELLEEEQQQQQQQVAEASEESASISNGVVPQFAHEDVVEYEAALKNDPKPSISVWSRAGVVKYAKFK